MSKLLTIVFGAAVLLLPTLPAAAEGSDREWIERVFTARSQGSEQSQSRAAARSASVKSTRAKVEVAATSDDDGSRPQRKTAAKPRPRESLSSDSGTTGVASYYWEPQALASGGRFNPNALTAAHKTLPFGTRVRVTHLGNGNSVDVVINDRGPYVGGRIIDLSKRAAQDIGMTGQGVARVRMTVLGRN